MADRVNPEVRSRLMAHIKGVDTRPECRFRKALWAAGLRYRLRPKLPGRPDLAFSSARVAIFIDGCFWHVCPLHGHVPKSNVDYWRQKLARNQERDHAVNALLVTLGWLPVRLWEHEIQKDLTGCVARVAELVRFRAKPTQY
ncbi:MAG: very short patch repair endonuclease [Thiobacillus sp.]